MDLRVNFVIQPESTSCKIVNFLLETRNREKRKKKKEKRRREASNLNPMNSKKYHLPLLFVGKKKGSNWRNLFWVINHRLSHRVTERPSPSHGCDLQRFSRHKLCYWSSLVLALVLSLSLFEAFKQTHYWLCVCVCVCLMVMIFGVVDPITGRSRKHFKKRMVPG